MTRISNEIGKPIIVVSVVGHHWQHMATQQTDIFKELSIGSIRLFERSRDGVTGTT